MRRGRVLVVVPEEIDAPTSWPGLVRPSVSSLVAPAQDVDGRAKPGHDVAMTWRASVLTLFPEMFPGPLAHVAGGPSAAADVWSLQPVNIRDFASDRHRTVDDTPFGGGAGMVLRPDVVDAAIASVADDRPLVFLTPRGRPLTQRGCAALCRRAGIVLLCGRYEGVDQRVIEARRHGRDQHRRLRAVRRRTAGAGAARCRGAAAAGRDGRGGQRRRRNHSRTTCWNTRTTRARPTGRGGACRTCCCPAITPRSPPGARPRRNGSPANAARTCGTRTHQPLARRQLPARRPRRKEISTEGP